MAKWTHGDALKRDVFLALVKFMRLERRQIRYTVVPTPLMQDPRQ